MIDLQIWDTENREFTDGTVVLLSKGLIDSRKVKINLSLEKLVFSEQRKNVSHEQIQQYVYENSGLKIGCHAFLCSLKGKNVNYNINYGSRKE